MFKRILSALNGEPVEPLSWIRTEVMAHEILKSKTPALAAVDRALSTLPEWRDPYENAPHMRPKRSQAAEAQIAYTSCYAMTTSVSGYLDHMPGLGIRHRY